MKRIVGYALSFVLGSVFAGSTVFAATNYVQALKGTSKISLNGSIIANPLKLVYGGTTYVQLYSIQHALQGVLGSLPGWDGTTFKMGTASPTVGNGGTSQQNIVAVSKLPYTFQAPDGATVKINSIKSTTQGVVINVTLSNKGLETGVAVPVSNFFISDGGPKVRFLTADNSVYDSILQPGQSTTGNLSFEPVPSGVTTFSLLVEDFDYNSYTLSVDLTH